MKELHKGYLLESKVREVSINKWAVQVQISRNNMSNLFYSGILKRKMNVVKKFIYSIMSLSSYRLYESFHPMKMSFLKYIKER